MVSYPIEKLDILSRKIQQLLAEYRNSQSASLYDDFSRESGDPRVAWEASNRRLTQASDNFMNTASIEVLPEVHKVLGEIDALLHAEDKSISERVRPILEQIQQHAKYTGNPLVYTELSSQLTSLAGHLSVRAVATPTVFVGFRYTDEDEIIAEKFIQLFRLEGFNPITGKPAKAVDVDGKVKGLIDQSEGVIIIFTRDRKIEGGKWTSSGWLKDEKAFAMGRNKPILLFFDDCIEESERKGIQGDYEHVVFRRECLDDSFLKAIPYLRDFRQRVLSKSTGK